MQVQLGKLVPSPTICSAYYSAFDMHAVKRAQCPAHYPTKVQCIVCIHSKKYA